jgi:hypothetical protein
MPYNSDPANWITGWNVSGSNLTIPLASIPKLTSAEATPGTGAGGDVRKCWYAILDRMFDVFTSKSSVGDAPTRMGVSKSATINTTTGVITSNYTLTFQTRADQEDVINE